MNTAHASLKPEQACRRLHCARFDWSFVHPELALTVDLSARQLFFLGETCVLASPPLLIMRSVASLSHLDARLIYGSGPQFCGDRMALVSVLFSEPRRLQRLACLNRHP